MTDRFGRPIPPKPRWEGLPSVPPPVSPPPVIPPPPPIPPPSAFLPAAPVPITRDVAFRATGDVPLKVWIDEFTRVNSPVLNVDVERMWLAAQGVSALVLDRLRAESSYCKNKVATNNCLGLRDRDGTSDFEWFASPVDGVKELVRRWSDKTYKNGTYYPKDLSLADMMTKYSPPSENDTESLIRTSVANINRWRSGSPTSPSPPSPPSSGSIAFGKVPVPKNFQERQIPDTQNHCWDNLGQRVLRGIVYHRMLGTLWGTDAWFRSGQAQGLTDWGVDYDSGEILRWNDYLGRGKPGISPNRSPWASGPWNHVPGDGAKFVQKHGVSGINRDLSAIEISGNYDTPLSAAGLEAIVALSAYLADVAKIPHDTYPIVPATGLVFTYGHSEFTNQKPCPGQVVWDLMPDIIERTAALLKRYQTGG